MLIVAEFCIEDTLYISAGLVVGGIMTEICYVEYSWLLGSIEFGLQSLKSLYPLWISLPA